MDLLTKIALKVRIRTAEMSCFFCSVCHRISKCNAELILNEVFAALKIEVEVLWVVTPCSVVVGYQRFSSP